MTLPLLIMGGANAGKMPSSVPLLIFIIVSMSPTCLYGTPALLKKKWRNTEKNILTFILIFNKVIAKEVLKYFLKIQPQQCNLFNCFVVHKCFNIKIAHVFLWYICLVKMKEHEDLYGLVFIQTNQISVTKLRKSIKTSRRITKCLRHPMRFWVTQYFE